MTLNNRILAGAVVGILLGVAFTRLGPADPFTAQGLYLCGAGAHPGGGVTGIPGRNAAREILRDRKKGR